MIHPSHITDICSAIIHHDDLTTNMYTSGGYLPNGNELRITAEINRKYYCRESIRLTLPEDITFVELRPLIKESLKAIKAAAEAKHQRRVEEDIEFAKKRQAEAEALRQSRGDVPFPTYNMYWGEQAMRAAYGTPDLEFIPTPNTQALPDNQAQIRYNQANAARPAGSPPLTQEQAEEMHQAWEATALNRQPLGLTRRLRSARNAPGQVSTPGNINVDVPQLRDNQGRDFHIEAIDEMARFHGDAEFPLGGNGNTIAQLTQDELNRITNYPVSFRQAASDQLQEDLARDREQRRVYEGQAWRPSERQLIQARGRYVAREGVDEETCRVLDAAIASQRFDDRILELAIGANPPDRTTTNIIIDATDQMASDYILYGTTLEPMDYLRNPLASVVHTRPSPMAQPGPRVLQAWHMGQVDVADNMGATGRIIEARENHRQSQLQHDPTVLTPPTRVAVRTDRQPDGTWGEPEILPPLTTDRIGEIQRQLQRHRQVTPPVRLDVAESEADRILAELAAEGYRIAATTGENGERVYRIPVSDQQMAEMRRVNVPGQRQVQGIDVTATS